MTSDFTEEHVTLDSAGDAIPAYATAPPGAGADTPTIVMTMHIWGVDKSQRETAQRLARAGFATIVPDLFARFDAPDGDGATDLDVFRPFAQRLQPPQVDADVRAATAWVKARHPRGKTGIIGFCMGGVLALRRTAGYADLFAAAAVWYGGIEAARIEPANVDVPIVASYGADDGSIPVAPVEAFFDALSVDHDLKIYPRAGHAFCDTERTSYVRDAAEDSYARAIAFLRRHLA